MVLNKLNGGIKVITFVEVGKSYNEFINEEYFEVKLTQLEVSQDHVYDTSCIKVDITNTESLDNVYKNVANTLLDYNKNEQNRYIFDTRVLYNRKIGGGEILTEEHTQNKHAEKIRQEYRKLIDYNPNKILVQSVQLHEKDAIDLHNKILDVLPEDISLETHYIFGVLNN